MGFDDDEEEGLTQAPKGQDESAGEKTAELISEKIVKFQADVIQSEVLRQGVLTVRAQITYATIVDRSRCVREARRSTRFGTKP